MKIALLTSMFPPDDIGGIEIASQDIANNLARKGNDVHVITSGKKNTTEILSQHLAVYRITNPRIPFLGSPIFWLKIFFVLKKIKPDIVHCQTIQMGVPGFLFKKIYKTPYIVWCHGFDVYFPWKFKRIISKIVFNSADAVIALTDNMKKELQQNFKKNIFVLPNGINLEKCKGLFKKELRRKFAIGDEEKIIIFAGTFKSVKGIEYLISAFKIIKNKSANARLFLAGDGNERKKMEDLVYKKELAGSVNFLGNISNGKVLEYMSASDIFVLPSLSEGLPMVILEAMASQLPIVSTNVGGISEIIKHKKNGFLVNPKNPEQIADTILILLKDDMLREKISATNKEEVKKYSLDAVVNKLMKMYSLAIGK